MNLIRKECSFQRTLADLNFSISGYFLSASQWFPDLNAYETQAKNALRATFAEKQSCGTRPCSSLQINKAEFKQRRNADNIHYCTTQLLACIFAIFK